MRFDEPSWWYDSSRIWPPRLLAPAEALYRRIAARRLATATPYRSRLPVICVGNFTAGGTGKTPLAIRIASHLVSLGARPMFLTRGYGGRLTGPHIVGESDTAREVGDEPLLLARHGPVMVARDRADGARAIEAQSGDRRADVILMDDGLQNPKLGKTLTIAVVDGRRGFGNERVIPAGPLRAPLELQLGLVDAIVVNGAVDATDGAAALRQRLRREFAGPVLAADTQAAGDTGWLRVEPVVAFCGIGAPQRFLDLLGTLGATIAARETYPDHHAFTARDAERLLTLSARFSARLVTTEKDLVRLKGLSGSHARLRDASRAIGIETTLEPRDEERLKALLHGALSRGGNGERR